MTNAELAELVSLSLTSPTLISAAVVIALWWKAAWRAVWTLQRSAHQWLILGVMCSFVGGFFDNTWWGIAWGKEFLKNPSAEWWFANGAFANVPFRQIAGILAGFCHVRSALQSRVEVSKLKEKRLQAFNLVLLGATAVSLALWAWVKWG